jgi:hypothetical protein
VAARPSTSNADGTLRSPDVGCGNTRRIRNRWIVGVLLRHRRMVVTSRPDLGGNDSMKKMLILTVRRRADANLAARPVRPPAALTAFEVKVSARVVLNAAPNTGGSRRMNWKK